MTAWLNTARSLLVLSCSKDVRKNRNWTAARTDVVRPGESFYKDGTASCGLTLERSDEEARLSHDAKRGRSRPCVSWGLSGNKSLIWRSREEGVVPLAVERIARC